MKDFLIIGNNSVHINILANMSENKFPKPIYERAVEAYLLEFTNKHKLQRADIYLVGVKEYPLYFVEPWMMAINFDDIRLDIDGLDYNGKHIDAPEDALYNLSVRNSEAYYHGEHIVNFRTHLISLLQ